MQQTDRIREQVTQFFAKHAIGNTAADAFPAWWLQRRFELAPLEAVRQCSNGPGDFGLDAFYLESATDKGPVLHLAQAKFSGNLNEVKKAVSGFERTMKELRPLLKGQPVETPKDNPLWMRLGSQLEKLGDARARLRLHFTVLNLVPQAAELVQHSLLPARETFEELAGSYLAEWFFTLTFVGPDQLGFPEAVVSIPGTPRAIRFEGAELPTSTNAKYFAGIGFLSDLVGLYEEYEDALFSKNVRMYLHKKAKEGPARHMRDTLKAICIGLPEKAMPTERFTIFHNGVTLHAQSAEMKEDGRVEIRNPSVLNGCQSVKNAYYFIHDEKLAERIDQGRWNQVRVPLRIVVTNDDELVRQVAVSNNRQTEIRPSAFWANDKEQLRLADRFARAKVFYERQEGAFQNLALAHPQRLEDEFSNSMAAPLRMEELAQAVAAAGAAGDRPALSVAAKVSDLFEESTYKLVFARASDAPIELLVFLRNLLKVCPLAVKDMRDNSQKLEGIPTGSFGYVAMRLLARYIIAEKPGLVAEHGSEVVARAGTTHPLRLEAVKLLGAHHTGMQQLVPELWLNHDRDEWRSAYDRDALHRALRKTKLDGVDVFEAYEPEEVDEQADWDVA